MEEVDIYSKASKEQKDIVTKLNPLYIKTRYEDYKNKIYKLLTKPYCEKLLTETEELFIWIKEFIK
jgi:HEPN domain-containing protein